MKSVNAITPEAEAALEAFLARDSNDDGLYSTGEVRGFLFAVAAAPELIPPSEWFPFICGGISREFEELEEAQQVMGTLMSLFNQANDEILAKESRNPVGCEFRDDIMANLEPDAPVSQWSRGFVVGHVWLAESWEETMPEEWGEEMGAILTTLSFFASPSLAGDVVEDSGDPETSLEKWGAHLRDLFPNAVRQYADMGRTISKALDETEEERREPCAAEPRIGRNAPCPCGSGKKYKRCCGS